MQPNFDQSYQASAPGSLILLGEYGVLHGKPALICAIDKRIKVTLQPRADQHIYVSSTLGEWHTPIYNITIAPPYQYIAAVLQYYQTQIKRGFELIVESEFSHEVGLGSSAAVTIATMRVLQRWLNLPHDPINMVRQGRQLIRLVQGVGSGADIAAAVYGGLVAYQPQPLKIEKIHHLWPLTVCYAGYKTKTADAIQYVMEKFNPYPQLFHAICHSIGHCAMEGIKQAKQQAWDKVGALMNMQQGLLSALGVNQPLLQTLTEELNEFSEVTGAKISGSGLGDCVIALGNVPIAHRFPEGTKRINIAMTLQGVNCEQLK